jgi:hypothetical protein
MRMVSQQRAVISSALFVIIDIMVSYFLTYVASLGLSIAPILISNSKMSFPEGVKEGEGKTRGCRQQSSCLDDTGAAARPGGGDHGQGAGIARSQS